MHVFRRLLPALCLAVPLALTACGGGGVEESEAPTITTTMTEQVTEEVAEAATEEPAAQDRYTEVAPERFLLGTAYVIGGDGDQWFHDCFFKTAADTRPFCHVSFVDPVPPAENPDGISTGRTPNIIAWDETQQRFSPHYSPGAETPLGTQPLKQGEQVTLNGLTVTHLHEGGYRVTMGDAAFEMHDGVYTTTDPVAPEPAAAPAPEAPPQTAAYGESCGTVESSMGGAYEVMALEDGTTCDVALDVMHGYVDAWATGAVEGQAGFWTAPNGWGCANGWFLPGDEQIRANAKNTCGDSDRAGRPASEGSGSFVALRPDEVGRL